MKVTDELGLFCVEMDAASPTSTYQDYLSVLPEGTKIQNLEDFDMPLTLYSNLTYNDRYGIVNAYNYRDQMLSWWDDGTSAETGEDNKVL